MKKTLKTLAALRLAGLASLAGLGLGVCGAAQAQTLPQPRCQPAAHLRICRFQPDRRTAAV